MNPNKTILACLIASFAISAAAKDVTISVRNTTAEQRQQLVEIDGKALREAMNITAGRPVIVRNAFGQEVPSQQTYDGKLLFEAAARPGTATSFTVCEGTPSSYKVFATGACYPQRLDDVAWENDRCAYRVYGPALQARGERSFGVDVWSKCTPDMVVEKRYQQDCYGNAVRDVYNRRGLTAQHDSVLHAYSFHFDRGEGLDAYAVGPSLGCGAPALVFDSRLVMPYCYKDYEILDNGPLRFTVRLTFPAVAVGRDKAVVEHRIILLDKGSNFNRCELWYDGLSRETNVAAGVVVHKADTESLVMDADKVLYADPTDRPDKLGTQVFVGVLFPDGHADSRLMPSDEGGDIVENAVGIVPYKSGQHLVYYFGSAWSGYDVRTFAEWQARAESHLVSLRHPFEITIK